MTPEETFAHITTVAGIFVTGSAVLGVLWMVWDSWYTSDYRGTIPPRPKR